MGKNIVRVRVDVNSKDDDREIGFKKMFITFKNVCKDVGIVQAYKQHATYESKSRKKRRKQRESEIGRLKGKLKENFT